MRKGIYAVLELRAERGVSRGLYNGRVQYVPPAGQVRIRQSTNKLFRRAEYVSSRGRSDYQSDQCPAETVTPEVAS